MAFLFLNERLEHDIQEWTIDEFINNDQRSITTKLFLVPFWKEMTVTNSTWQDFRKVMLAYSATKEFPFFHEDRTCQVFTLISKWNHIESFGVSKMNISIICGIQLPDDCK